VDLSKLNDDELALLERLIAKAEGRFAGDKNPAFKIEFVERGQSMIESNALIPCRRCGLYRRKDSLNGRAPKRRKKSHLVWRRL